LAELCICMAYAGPGVQLNYILLSGLLRAPIYVSGFGICLP
jgi:hypothetical protein